MGVNAKKVGNAYELDIRNEYKGKGWDGCQTSRYASKKADDDGIDLVGTSPFNIQCKRWKSAPSYHSVLKKMPDDENYNLIFHKRPHKGEVVVMTKETWYEILDMLIDNGVINPK